MCPGKPGSAVMADDAKNQWCFGKESVEAAIAAVGRGELVSCHPPLVDSARSSFSFRSFCCNFLALAQQRHSIGAWHTWPMSCSIFPRGLQCGTFACFMTPAAPLRPPLWQVVVVDDEDRENEGDLIMAV